MKLRSTFYLFLLVVATQLFFACGTAKYYDFGSRNANGNTERASAEKAIATDAELPQTEIAATVAEAELTTAEASAGIATPAPAVRPAYMASATQPEAAPAQKAFTKTEAKQLIKELKAARKEARNNKQTGSTSQPLEVGTLLLVILAILLPPLAVYLVRGLSTEFWISLLLTLLFFLPGVIYALYIVLSR